MNIEPTIVTYQLNETQIRILLRRHQYGHDLATQVETPGEKEILADLMKGLEVGLKSARLAQEHDQLTKTYQPSINPTSVLGVHQMD